MKDLMRKLIILTILSWSITSLALPKVSEIQAPKKVVCSFKSGDIGRIKFQGNNRDQAVEKTAKACLRARVALYKTARGKRPTVERRILFAEDCVNKTHCRR